MKKPDAPKRPNTVPKDAVLLIGAGRKGFYLLLRL